MTKGRGCPGDCIEGGSEEQQNQGREGKQSMNPHAPCSRRTLPATSFTTRGRHREPQPAWPALQGSVAALTWAPLHSVLNRDTLYVSESRGTRATVPLLSTVTGLTLGDGMA